MSMGNWLMKQVIEMLSIYKPLSGKDWMNYKLIKKDVTFHHIIKKEDGGKREVDNGALLMPVSHQYLHIIEYKDINTYISINNIFRIINSQLHEPTTEQREIIEFLLRRFECEHIEDINSKGKLLIKKQYLNRL